MVLAQWLFRPIGRISSCSVLHRRSLSPSLTSCIISTPGQKGSLQFTTKLDVLCSRRSLRSSHDVGFERLCPRSERSSSLRGLPWIGERNNREMLECVTSLNGCGMHHIERRDEEVAICWVRLVSTRYHRSFSALRHTILLKLAITDRETIPSPIHHPYTADNS